LEHHVERLAEDHANAQRLADGIRRIDRLRLEPETPETNLVFFQVDPAWGGAAEFAARLTERGVMMLATSPTTIRAVTHLDVSTADVDRAIQAIQAIACGRG
jgi:threonine aldolase